jgi:hypothetical protein
VPQNVLSIAHDEIALPFIAFHQAMAGYLRQLRVGIECNDMTYRLSADPRENFSSPPRQEIRVEPGYAAFVQQPAQRVRATRHSFESFASSQTVLANNRCKMRRLYFSLSKF